MTMIEKGWTEDELEQRYYEWLISLVPAWNGRYQLLLRNLYETPFRVTILMDENRVGDGLSLRSRFIWMNQRSNLELVTLKSRRPCSVLEVMIGLAQRFNEEYMTQYNDEDPVGLWFGPMIRNLGLEKMDDQHFNPIEVHHVLRTFLDRDYSPDGRGSLFYIPGITQDMRQMEIWRQMMLWNEYV